MEQSPPADRPSRLVELLSRPDEQRLREYKYRFSQSIVFGLPVIALQYWGPALGPADSERWVSLLQTLLAGWVLYVNLGMFFEGVLLLPRISPDLPVAVAAIALYLYSFASAVCGILTARLLYKPLLFHVCVALLMAWSVVRWRNFAARVPCETNARDRADQPEGRRPNG